MGNIYYKRENNYGTSKFAKQGGEGQWKKNNKERKKSLMYLY